MNKTKKNVNIKYVDQYIRNVLERKAWPYIHAAQEEGCDKDCGRYSRKQLEEAIGRIIDEANTKIIMEADKLGFQLKRDLITANDYWVNQIHSPEYYLAEEKVAAIKDIVEKETRRLALRVAMGLTCEELEKEIDGVKFYAE